MREQPLCLDCYPYIASSTVLRYDRLEQSSRVIITWSKPHPEFSGVDLDEVAHRLGMNQAQAVEKIKPAGAAYKMTGLPAKNFRLSGRGVLQQGAHADITLFDAALVIDAADFRNSTEPAKGIDTVIVNGEMVWRDGKPTGARPGKLLLNERRS